MQPLTTNFTECSEPTAETLGVVLGIEFALRFSLLSSRPLAAATASSPEKVLLGDFQNPTYLIQKELDQEGKFTGAGLSVTLTVGGGLISGERLCKAYFDNESSPSATASVSVTSLGGSTYGYSADIGITSNRTLTRLDMIIGGNCNTGNVNYCLTGLNVPLHVGKLTALTTSLHTAAEYNSCNTTTNSFYTVQPEQNVGPVGTGMGLVYFGARYYDPEIGVWTSCDVAHEFWSPYAYAANPLIFVDPNGLANIYVLISRNNFDVSPIKGETEIEHLLRQSNSFNVKIRDPISKIAEEYKKLGDNLISKYDPEMADLKKAMADKEASRIYSVMHGGPSKASVSFDLVDWLNADSKVEIGNPNLKVNLFACYQLKFKTV